MRTGVSFHLYSGASSYPPPTPPSTQPTLSCLDACYSPTAVNVVQGSLPIAFSLVTRPSRVTSCECGFHVTSLFRSLLGTQGRPCPLARPSRSSRSGRIGISCPVFLCCLTRTAGSHLPKHLSTRRVAISMYLLLSLLRLTLSKGFGDLGLQQGKRMPSWTHGGADFLLVPPTFIFPFPAGPLPYLRVGSPSLTARRALYHCGAHDLVPVLVVIPQPSLQSSERLSAEGAHEDRAAVITLSLSTT